jgi:damage-control phosphatase, subfamily I
MRIFPQCYDCLKTLAGQASSLATENCALREEARLEGEKALKRKFLPGEISIVIASAIHDAVGGVTGNPDAYRSMKDTELEIARQLFSSVKNEFGDDFTSLLKLAALGNAIDFFRPIEEVKREIAGRQLKFTIDDSALLEGKVKKAKLMLYLADNSGEVFFDMPLLNLMRKYGRVVYVVKESPVQNDITIEEIRKAGMEKEAGEVMTTGTATAGIDLNRASEEFKDIFNRADFVLAKGMGYYETLEELPAEGRIFFCLKAKCAPVAEWLKVPLLSYVAILH